MKAMCDHNLKLGARGRVEWHRDWLVFCFHRFLVVLDPRLVFADRKTPAEFGASLIKRFGSVSAEAHPGRRVGTFTVIETLWLLVRNPGGRERLFE
jgi:hypothetical protein